VIEGVESFEPELQRFALSNLRHFVERQVEVIDSRSIEEVSLRIFCVPRSGADHFHGSGV